VTLPDRDSGSRGRKTKRVAVRVGRFRTDSGSERGEDWSCCYIDEVAFVVDGIRGNTRIPPSPLLQHGA
jgi:hypothetical protein